jgi:hypothetical protein
MPYLCPESAYSWYETRFFDNGKKRETVWEKIKNFNLSNLPWRVGSASEIEEKTV